MPSRGQAELDADLAAIAEAKANGFMDCLAIRNGLGWDKPKANGSWYSSSQVAYRWIVDAGEEVVYILPDGPAYDIDGVRKTIPKTQRTGCYDDVFARVLAHKNAYYARLKHDEWTRNMADAESHRALYGAQTKYMDWDAYIEGLGPEPSAPDEAVVAAVEERKAVKVASKEEIILQAMREYTGPMNKTRTYPKGIFMGLRGKAKRDLWDRRNG